MELKCAQVKISAGRPETDISPRDIVSAPVWARITPDRTGQKKVEVLS